MRHCLIIIISSLLSANFYGQEPVIINRIISNESSDCQFPKFLLNEYGQALIVYYNQGFICYDMLSADLTKMVEHVELQSSTVNYESFFEIALLDRDHFVLFWIASNGGSMYLHYRIFDLFGMPRSMEINLSRITQTDFFISENNLNNNVCISYNNGENIVIRYLKNNMVISDEINIFNLSKVTNQFYFTTDFLPNDNIAFHWVDYSRKIYTLFFNSTGNQVIDNSLITENTTSEYIVTDVFAAHNLQGDFYLIWPHYTAEGRFKIFAQKFLNGGAKNGPVFAVTDLQNSLTPYLGQLDASFDKDGDCVVIWSDDLANAPSTSLYGQLLDRNNKKQGTNFLITGPANTPGIEQYTPSIQWLNDQLLVCFNQYDPAENANYTVNLNITNVVDGNVAPQFNSQIEDQEMCSMDTLFIDIDESIIYDPDLEEVDIRIRVDTASIPPYWVFYNRNDRNIRFTPQDYHQGSYKITLFASDKENLMATSSFTLKVKSGQIELPFNGEVLTANNSEYSQFLLSAADTVIFYGEEVNANELIYVENRQAIQYEWMEKSMQGYVNGEEFRNIPTENTWIAVKATDEYGCILQDTIIIILSYASSSEDLKAEPPFIIYPNPTNGLIYFKINAPETGFGLDQVNIYDVGGKIVYSRDLTGNHSIIELNLSHLKSGIYLISITDKQNNQSLAKIMIH